MSSMTSADSGREHDHNEYVAGYAAGLGWLHTKDGIAYLDPDLPDDASGELPYDRSRDRPGQVMAGPYNQGVVDAVKHVSWHSQRPGQLCAEGPDCVALAWLRTLGPSQID